RRMKPLSLLLLLLIAVPLSMAQQPAGRSRTIDAQSGSRGGRGGGGGANGGANRAGQTAADFVAVRQKLLDAETPDLKDFGALVTSANNESTQRKLPSFGENPENTYTPELIAFRQEVYAPLRESPVLREFLRGMVRKAAT